MRLLRPPSLAFIALAGLLALSGCNSASSVSGQDSGRTLTTSANTRWLLVNWTSADGVKPPLLAPVPTLNLGYAGQVGGQAGVNFYNGTARIAGGELSWGGGFALTRRTGPDDLMAGETRYLADLRATRHATVRGGRLILTGDAPLRLEFARAPE